MDALSILTAFQDLADNAYFAKPNEALYFAEIKLQTLENPVGQATLLECLKLIVCVRGTRTSSALDIPHGRRMFRK